jgi:hypothetical protein
MGEVDVSYRAQVVMPPIYPTKGQLHSFLIHDYHHIAACMP